MTQQRTQTRTKQQDTPLDISALLRKHGHWYGSTKTRLQEMWLIAFWNGMLLSSQDTLVEQNTPNETWQARMTGSWQLWTTAEGQEALSFKGFYQTVQQGPIRLRQFQTETQHQVYLMENLCAYLEDRQWSFWYVPLHHTILVKDQDNQPYAVFREFVPQIPIRPVERKKG